MSQEDIVFDVLLLVPGFATRGISVIRRSVSVFFFREARVECIIYNKFYRYFYFLIILHEKNLQQLSCTRFIV